jgi:hypothetical protein
MRPAGLPGVGSPALYPKGAGPGNATPRRPVAGQRGVGVGPAGRYREGLSLGVSDFSAFAGT